MSRRCRAHAAKWASTIVTGYDFKQAQRTGFWVCSRL